ncbi:MAG TPA: hypothetical protein V6C99_12560 [Oculatellaceae cyanobacterium]|jgi:NAD(P)H-flavin reductase
MLTYALNSPKRHTIATLGKSVYIPSTVTYSQDAQPTVTGDTFQIRFGHKPTEKTHNEVADPPLYLHRILAKDFGPKVSPAYTEYVEEQLKRWPTGFEKQLRFNPDAKISAPVLDVKHYRDAKGNIYTTELLLDVSQSNFRDPERKKLRLFPGHHVLILLPGVEETYTQDEEMPDGRIVSTEYVAKKGRWFSIASPSTGEDGSGRQIRLFIRRYIPEGIEDTKQLVSQYASELSPGDTVELMGPCTNDFLGPETPDIPIVCLGVGTSVAPYRAMFLERFKNQRNMGAFGDAFLGMGYATPDLAYASKEFQTFAKNPENKFQFKAAYSRSPQHPRKHVTDLVRENIDTLLNILKQPNARMYISGFSGLDEQIEAELLQAAKPEERKEVQALIQRLKDEGRWRVESSSVPATARNGGARHAKTV